MALTDVNYKKWLEMSLEDATTQVQVAPKISEQQFRLNANAITPSLTGFPTTFTLSNAQTGSADSTNTFDFGNNKAGREGAMVKIVTTVGSTPTCTFQIRGSKDNSTFFNLLYADSATPSTFVSSTFVITTATTVAKLIKPGQVWRYLKITYSANTNVTITAAVIPFGD